MSDMRSHSGNRRGGRSSRSPRPALAEQRCAGRANAPIAARRSSAPIAPSAARSRDMHRRSVCSLVHDFIEDIVSFDSRILRTARALLFQPGELPRAFREGRTRRYVPAMRLYFFVSLIFFVILGGFTASRIMQLRGRRDAGQGDRTTPRATPSSPTRPTTGRPGRPQAAQAHPASTRQDAAEPGRPLQLFDQGVLLRSHRRLPLQPAVRRADRLQNRGQHRRRHRSDAKAKAAAQAKAKAAKGWVNQHVFGDVARLAAIRRR